MNEPTETELAWGNKTMQAVTVIMPHLLADKPTTQEELRGVAYGLIEAALLTLMRVHRAEEPEHDPDFTLRLTCLAREAIENELRESAKQRN